MKIQTIIGLLCFAAVSSLLLKASGVVKPMWKARKDVLSTEDFLELSDKICESDESTGEDTLDCIIDLHAANKRHGYTSDFFYARLSHWTEVLSPKSGVKAHPRASNELIRYQVSYSYNKYLKPVLMEANNVAATRATDFAFFNLTMAACISVIAFLLFRYTKPDSYALPMPNFYETSRTQRNSSIFATVQNYFHGPKLSDLPLAGGFGKGKKSARYIM